MNQRESHAPALTSRPIARRKRAHAFSDDCVSWLWAVLPPDAAGSAALSAELSQAGGPAGDQSADGGAVRAHHAVRSGAGGVKPHDVWRFS